MKTILKTFITLLICAMMAMPVSAAYHDSGNDVGANGVLNKYNSWLTPWVGVPRGLCGSWEIHGYIYYKGGRDYYRDAHTTYLSAWRRMYGWTYYHKYITGHDLHGGWID